MKGIEMKDDHGQGFVIDRLTVDFTPSRLLDQLKRLRNKDHGVVRALHELCLAIAPGKAVGLLGESGCGKSTLARQIMGLLKERDPESRITFEGQDLDKVLDTDEQAFRNSVQMIFQHPDTFLNPKLMARDMVMEAFHIRGESKADIQAGRFHEELGKALDVLGLTWEDLEKTSDQLSGGEKKRMSILRVILAKPRYIIADEPFSGLDVSYRNRILKQFEILKEAGVGFLLISHDFHVTKKFCDEICVMYKGRIVHRYENPESGVPEVQHPYTQVLIVSNDYLARCHEALPEIMGKFKPEMGEKDWRTAGCPFEDRCFYSDNTELKDACRTKTPPEQRVMGSHVLRCHLFEAKEQQP
jgi:oligopeptide/dipeptide ABC transporter ATP-binding protein